MHGKLCGACSRQDVRPATASHSNTAAMPLTDATMRALWMPVSSCSSRSAARMGFSSGSMPPCRAVGQNVLLNVWSPCAVARHAVPTVHGVLQWVNAALQIPEWQWSIKRPPASSIRWSRKVRPTVHCDRQARPPALHHCTLPAHTLCPPAASASCPGGRPASVPQTPGHQAGRCTAPLPAGTRSVHGWAGCCWPPGASPMAGRVPPLLAALLLPPPLLHRCCLGRCCGCHLLLLLLRWACGGAWEGAGVSCAVLRARQPPGGGPLGRRRCSRPSGTRAGLQQLSTTGTIPTKHAGPAASAGRASTCQGFGDCRALNPVAGRDLSVATDGLLRAGTAPGCRCATAQLILAPCPRCWGAVASRCSRSQTASQTTQAQRGRRSDLGF